MTREDCARAAAAVLTGDGHQGRAYDITGPTVVFPQDIAKAASAITGMPIDILDPETAVEKRPPPPGSASYAVVSSAVRELTGTPPESVADLLARSRDALLAPVRSSQAPTGQAALRTRPTPRG